MSDDIKRLKDKLCAIGLSFKEDSESCASPLSWIGELLIFGMEPLKPFGSEVIEWLKTYLKFEFIDCSTREDLENGFSIISLNNTMYRLDYQMGSYSEIDGGSNLWDWKPVQSKQKTVTVYE